MVWSVFPIVWNSKAHQFCQNAHKKSPHKIFPKSAQFLTPQTTFIAFLCINFFSDIIFCTFFSFSVGFFYIFPQKGIFCCFKKAHKKFSKRHQPFKGAPMCAKAHTIGNSGELFDIRRLANFKA